MAFANIVPVSLSTSFNPNWTLKSYRTPVVKTQSGSVVDFTTWDTFLCVSSLKVANCAFSFADVLDTANSEITAHNDGTVDILMRSVDLTAAAIPGTHEMTLLGKPTSGDSFQVIGSGSLVLTT